MGPLAGVKVIEIANGIHAPYAAMLLADMGADVLKIEPPQGDLNRSAAVVQGPITIGSQYYACNRNKRVMTVNLTTERGREIVRQLVLESDVLIENMRPGVLAKFGLGYDDLKDQNPRLVYASATAYGLKGPRSSLPSLDIVAQAAGGLVAHTGTEETGPLPAGTAIADHVGAIWLAYGVMLALFARAQSGQGQRVDSSLLGSQMATQAWEMNHFLLSGVEPSRGGPSHALARGPWRVFRAKDGWFAIGGITDARWPRLCAAIGAESLVEDPRFAASDVRLQNSDELNAELGNRFEELPLEKLINLLEAADQVAAPVMSYADLANDPTVRANGYLVEFASPDGLTLPMLGIPIGLSRTPGSIRTAPPGRDAHTAEVLADLGLDSNEIAELFNAGVVGAPSV